MVKIIQRTTDNKYFKSLENDLWVEDINEAFEMSYREFQTNKEALLSHYEEISLKEIINMQKTKEITKEEKKELLNQLTRRQ